MSRVATAFLVFAAVAVAQPQFSFAVLTDIQYGDQATAGRRDYRQSLPRLRQAVAALNEGPELTFAIQLGDLIDSKPADLDVIFPVLSQLTARLYHVLGNHDFAMRRDLLQQRLGLPAAYYDFACLGWRFLVLDGMDVSVNPGARAAGPLRSQGESMLADLRGRSAPNANDWNGAIGAAQAEWIRKMLRQAEESGERVILFCHFPILREASTPAHLLWNHEEILALIEGSPAVAAWFNGHDHAGGYAVRNGIHHVTFPGMVESGARNSYTTVYIYSDRIALRGVGTAESRTLMLKGAR